MSQLHRFSISVVWTLALFVGACGAEELDEGPGLDDQVELDEEAEAEAIETVAQALADQCGHSICEPGPAVGFNCDTCVQQICAQDPYCCTNYWDNICVNEVSTICGLGPTPVTSNTSVSSLKVRIRTGGDDLRSGSQAYGSFQLAGGVTLPRQSLNNGAGYPNNSVNTAIITFSPARTLGSLKGFTLEWDGAPRRWPDGYDNWNADELRFMIEPAGRCPTYLGAPFYPGRMTGSRTVVPTSVTFP
jgi:hypothetical protein